MLSNIHQHFYELIFDAITSDFQLLKSGRGEIYRGAYKKSMLFEHFCNGEQKIRWEKRKIKQKINNQDTFNQRLYAPNKPPIDCNNRNSDRDKGKYEYRYIRALLGLSENFEYLIEDRSSNWADKNRKYVVNIKHDAPKEEQIERFQSPIFFKVFEDTIFVVGKNIQDYIHDRDFKFTLKQKEKRGRDFVFLEKKIALPDSIKTPSKEEFQLNVFLEENMPKLKYQTSRI